MNQSNDLGGDFRVKSGFRVKEKYNCQNSTNVELRVSVNAVHVCLYTIMLCFK